MVVFEWIDSLLYGKILTFPEEKKEFLSLFSYTSSQTFTRLTFTSFLYSCLLPKKERLQISWTPPFSQNDGEMYMNMNMEKANTDTCKIRTQTLHKSLTEIPFINTKTTYHKTTKRSLRTSNNMTKERKKKDK